MSSVSEIHQHLMSSVSEIHQHFMSSTSEIHQPHVFCVWNTSTPHVFCVWNTSTPHVFYVWNTLIPHVLCVWNALRRHAFCVCNVITLSNQFLFDLFLITAVTKSEQMMQMLESFIETRTANSRMIIVCQTVPSLQLSTINDGPSAKELPVSCSCHTERRQGIINKSRL